MHASSLILCLVLSSVLLGPIARGEDLPGQIPDSLKNIGITENLGRTVSISELNFYDESGQTVSLSKYFRQGRPVVLNLVYYECPNLCGMVLNGMTETLKKLEWEVGKQFEVVSVSINPKEKSDLAAKKKAAYLQELGKPAAAFGWHFLTGKENDIKKLAQEVGFGYRYIESEQQFAHAAALFVLTPEGKISRYLFGIEYKVQDFKLALLEASNGKIGTIVERLMLFCYRYDPQTRRYSVWLTRLMQAGAAATLVVFGGYLGIFWNRQRKKVLKREDR